MFSYTVKNGPCFERQVELLEKQATMNEAITSYKEVKIGKTLYRVTSVFSGEKDLARTLEQLAVRRAMAEINPPQTACTSSAI